MKCPNCLSDVTSGTICTRCDAVLPISSTFNTPVFPIGTQDTEKVPLTFSQKARLLLDCLPLPFFVLAFVFTVTMLDDIVGAPPHIGLVLFLGLVVLVLGWTAFQRLRDLASGVACVQADELERSWRSGRRRAGHFYGRFTHLGKLRLTRKSHFGSNNGKRYRVIYSPASKIVWALEPLT